MAMSAGALRKFCMSLTGATEQIQWTDNRVFKIGGKMFAVSGTDKGARYSLKVDRERFLELTDMPGIVPAPYLARASWVQIDPSECRLPAAELRELVRSSYDLVLAALPKKTRLTIQSTK